VLDARKKAVKKELEILADRQAAELKHLSEIHTHKVQKQLELIVKQKVIFKKVFFSHIQ